VFTPDLTFILFIQIGLMFAADPSTGRYVFDFGNQFNSRLFAKVYRKSFSVFFSVLTNFIVRMDIYLYYEDISTTIDYLIIKCIFFVNNVYVQNQVG
jgi:hypothetical protein